MEKGEGGGEGIDEPRNLQKESVNTKKKTQREGETEKENDWVENTWSCTIAEANILGKTQKTVEWGN